METKIKELEYAKKAVESILKDANCSVDFHGIKYWAERVELLREEIKKAL